MAGRDPVENGILDRVSGVKGAAAGTDAPVVNRTSLERTAAHVPGFDDPGIVICTGAGVSVASGLPTYRGPGGHYDEDPSLAAITDGSRVEDELDTLWARWGPFRADIAAVFPNAGHRAIAELALRRDDVTVITMNVDGLHRRALTDLGGHVAPERLVEIHGDLARSRCVRGCGRRDWVDTDVHTSAPPCPGCGGPSRPAVVLFGEQPMAEAQWHAKRAVRGVTTFVAVGTSETVSTGTRLAANARFAGARMIWVNVEPPVQPGLWHHIELGPAEATLPVLLPTLG